MKNLITAALIAMIALSATTVKADPVEDAVQCVYDHFDNQPHGKVLTERGYEIVEALASVYKLGEFLEGRYEKTRESVKVIFGPSAGEVNYCFRQHMGG